MLIGMMWKTNKVTVEAIQQGIAFYEKEYGIKPNLCFYCKEEKDFPQIPKPMAQEIEFVASVQIPEGNIWFGVKNKQA